MEATNNTVEFVSSREAIHQSADQLISDINFKRKSDAEILEGDPN